MCQTPLTCSRRWLGESSKGHQSSMEEILLRQDTLLPISLLLRSLPSPLVSVPYFFHLLILSALVMSSIFLRQFNIVWIMLSSSALIHCDDWHIPIPKADRPLSPSHGFHWHQCYYYSGWYIRFKFNPFPQSLGFQVGPCVEARCHDTFYKRKGD